MANEMEMYQLVMRECFRKQIEEYELLKAMYSNPGEFQADNPYLVSEIEDYLSGNRSSVSKKLDYRIKLKINEKIKIELSVMDSRQGRDLHFSCSKRSFVSHFFLSVGSLIIIRNA